MNVAALIEELKKMPQDSEVCHLWDGEARTEIEHVWLARGGHVMTADFDEVCYSESSRPETAPDEKDDRYWSTPNKPAPPQLLASDIPADPTGWWVSEKYDGVRAIWTGEKLLTRNGKNLNPPAWFTAGLPNCRLDGELWMGRGTFDHLVSVIQTKGSDWNGVRFMVFDLAEAGTFEERNAKLQSIRLPHHCWRVRHTILQDAGELDRRERDIVAIGGEGLVIRRPGHLYRPGRMGDVIKVKRLVADVDRWQG